MIAKSIKARLLDLEGKYYGTKIEISILGYKYVITLWNNTNDHNPSDRELAKNGYTRKQWEMNSLVKDGWGGKIPIREVDIVCDSHYECRRTYELAKYIVGALRRNAY